MFKQTVFLVFCLFFFSRTVSGDERDYQKDVDLLISKGLQKAAIIGLDGNAYATSPEFKLVPGDGAELVELFNNPSDAKNRAIQISRMKYIIYKADSRSIYGTGGSGGVTCVKTNKLILIGVYNYQIHPRNAILVVEAQGDDLIENGY